MKEFLVTAFTASIKVTWMKNAQSREEMRSLKKKKKLEVEKNNKDQGNYRNGGTENEEDLNEAKTQTAGQQQNKNTSK